MEERKDGIWIIDAEAKTIFANDTMASILGVTSAQMIDGSSFDYIFPEGLADAQRLFNAKREGDPSPFRFTLRRKDGSPVPVVVQGTPMYNAAGQFIGIVGTFTVVGERSSS